MQKCTSNSTTCLADFHNKATDCKNLRLGKFQRQFRERGHESDDQRYKEAPHAQGIAADLISSTRLCRRGGEHARIGSAQSIHHLGYCSAQSNRPSNPRKPLSMVPFVENTHEWSQRVGNSPNFDLSVVE